MSFNRSLRKLIAVMLAGASVAAGIAFGAQPATGDTARPASVANDESNANGMPAILPRETASQLAALERWEAVEFFSDPPASAPYSSAEFNAYGRAHK